MSSICSPIGACYTCRRPPFRRRRTSPLPVGWSPFPPGRLTARPSTSAAADQTGARSTACHRGFEEGQIRSDARAVRHRKGRMGRTPEPVLAAAETGMSITRAEGFARRPLPSLLHVGLRRLSRLPARQRPLSDGPPQRQAPAACSATATRASRGTAGRAIRAGSSSAASATTVGSPGRTSAILTPAGGSISRSCCRKKTRPSTIRGSRHTTCRS